MRRFPAPLLLVLLSACATSGASGESGAEDPRARVYEPDQVDQAPELIQCGDWIDHGESRLRFAVVQFVVTATGAVRDPRVIQAPPREPEVGVEAMRIARTCRYGPAMLGGNAVAVRWSKRFDFPEGS